MERGLKPPLSALRRDEALAFSAALRREEALASSAAHPRRMTWSVKTVTFFA
jgi:hypothetical protein